MLLVEEPVITRRTSSESSWRTPSSPRRNSRSCWEKPWGQGRSRISSTDSSRAVEASMSVSSSWKAVKVRPASTRAISASRACRRDRRSASLASWEGTVLRASRRSKPVTVASREEVTVDWGCSRNSGTSMVTGELSRMVPRIAAETGSRSARSRVMAALSEMRRRTESAVAVTEPAMASPPQSCRHWMSPVASHHRGGARHFYEAVEGAGRFGRAGTGRFGSLARVSNRVLARRRSVAVMRSSTAGAR